MGGKFCLFLFLSCSLIYQSAEAQQIEQDSIQKPVSIWSESEGKDLLNDTAYIREWKIILPNNHSNKPQRSDRTRKNLSTPESVRQKPTDE
jgi:hypothetical protein